MPQKITIKEARWRINHIADLPYLDEVFFNYKITFSKETV